VLTRQSLIYQGFVLISPYLPANLLVDIRAEMDSQIQNNKTNQNSDQMPVWIREATEVGLQQKGIK